MSEHDHETVIELEKRFLSSIHEIPRLSTEREMRECFLQLALDLQLRVQPSGREWALVLTKLEEAMHWALEGVARHDG